VVTVGDQSQVISSAPFQVTFDGLSVGYHIASYTSDGDCSKDIGFNITEPAALVGSILSSTPEICAGSNTGSAIAVASGGVKPYTFLWTDSNGVTQITIEPTITGLSGDTYTVIVRDANGCEVNAGSFTIAVYNAVVANAGPDQIIHTTSTMLAGNNPQPSIGNWMLSSGPNTPVIVNPNSHNTEVTGLTKGTYVFRWTVQNHPCPDDWDEMIIEVIPNINIPDGFTPDDDGRGDRWIITGLELYPNHVVKIFNRWGSLVYESSPYVPWDGVANSGNVLTGLGKKLPAGVYFYVIVLEPGMKPLGGSIHLFY
jgi:gliding motility-associated-like protein